MQSVLLVRSSTTLLLLLLLCWMDASSLGVLGKLEDAHDLDDEDGVEDGQIPAKLDREDIAFFFDTGSSPDDLFDVLHYLFEISSRMPEDDDDLDEEQQSKIRHPLPEALLDRGSGDTFTTRAKLELDLEQALYLASVLEDETEQAFFGDICAGIYQSVLDNIPNATTTTTTLEDGDLMAHYYFFTEQDYDVGIDMIYNKAWRPTLEEPLVDEETGDLLALLNPFADPTSLQKQYLDNHGVLVLDDFLTDEALAKLQQVLWQSTVWFEANADTASGAHSGGSYIAAAHLDDGLYDKLVLQLAWQIHAALQDVHVLSHDWALHDIWARKYPHVNVTTTAKEEEEEESRTLFMEVGDPLSTLRVHLWLAPTTTTLQDDDNDATTTTTTTTTSDGELLVFTAQPPRDWPWSMGPTGAEVVETVLQPSQFANVTVPFKVNRAVIFDALLFHQHESPSATTTTTTTTTTPTYYEQRPMDITFLYGTAVHEAYGGTGEQEGEEL